MALSFDRGKQEGFDQGDKQGFDRGEKHGLVQALFSILAARGVIVGPAERRAIEACRDLDVLTRWVTRAMTVTAAGEGRA